jgi:hypothetical protein
MADTSFSTRFGKPRAYSPEPGAIAVSVPRYRDQPARGTADEEFLTLARQRFHTVADSESQMRTEQIIDQRFMASEQWPDVVKADRDQDGRPCLTINRLPVFKSQVTNQQRQAKPSIQINPVDSRSDPKTAEVLQGIIRHIENQSYADIAYDTACDSQVTIGRGYFRVVVEWDEVNPWQQNIRIKRIRNPFSVYFDPSCHEFDYSDARYAFIIEDIPKDEFVKKYGIDPRQSVDLFAMQGDRSSDWMPEGKVRVAEYFYIEEETEKIALLSNGEQFTAKQLDDPDMQAFMQEIGVTVVRTRTRTVRKVKWVKMTGSVVLERREWPGRWIPIIPVLGVELDINGKIDLRGMVRDARDPQRMYNYWVSAETEAIALAPKTPFIGAEGQFEGHESKWKLANRRNFAYLEYKIKTAANEVVPPPARQVLEPPIAAIVAATKQADNDLKAVTGFYDASLGEQGPEQSGKAILARQRQGDMSNSHWVDNLVRALRALGRQLIDLIPKIYDTPRVMRILGIDNQPLTVMIHSGMPDQVPSVDDGLEQGIQGIYDLSVGQFDVTVSVGPSIQSRRVEAVEAMTAFIQAFPAAAPVIGDVLADNMDWPGANIVAKRLRKMVPPEVLESDNSQLPPEAQAQINALQQQLQQTQQALQQAGQIIQTKQVENESRERIAQLQSQTQTAIAQLNLQLQAAKLQSDHGIAAQQLQSDREMQGAKLGVEMQKAQLDHQKQQASTLATIAKAHADTQKAQTDGLKVQADIHKVTVDASTKQAEIPIKAASVQNDRFATMVDSQTKVAMQQSQQEHEMEMLRAEQSFEARQAAVQREHDGEIETQRMKTTKEVAKAKVSKPNMARRAKTPGGK